MLKLSNLETIGRPVYNFHNLHSVDFDGVDDFIQLGEPISYTQHTISTWVKITAGDSSSTIIDSRDASNDGIRIRVTPEERIEYELNASHLTTTSSYSGEWIHIVATYDGTTQKLYINANLDQSATTSQTISTTTNAKIGARNFSDRANEFLGKIDELAIFDRALTADEVTAIFRIKYGANLVQNGRFDELGSDLIPQPVNLSNSPILTNGDGVINSSNQFETFGGTLDGIKTNDLLTLGKTYKLIIEGNTTSSGFTIGNTTGSGNQYGSGFGTHYFVATDNRRIWIRQATAGVTTITNFSVKQVDPNDRWTLGTGWSYGDGIASCDGTQSSSSDLNTTSGFSVQNNAVKVTFVLVRTAGNLSATLEGTGQLDLTNLNSSGTYTFIATSSDATARLILRADADFIGSITNVMLEQQKYVATNLKLNSGNYKSADPVIVSTKSVEFDGTDDYLEVQDATALQLAGSQATWSFWTKLDTLSGGDMKFLAKAISAGSDLAGYQIRTNNADLLYQFNNGSWRTVTASNFFLDLNFTHVAITHDGSNNVKIYRNGVLIEDSSIGYVIPANTGELLFGARTPDSPTNFLNGKLDEVGIFNTALTSDQVIELYNQGVPNNLSTHSANANLAAYYKMGDGTLDEAPLIADQTNATLGSELVVNGDFATDSDWSKQTGWSISNGSASYDGSGTGHQYILQSITTTPGGTYKINFDVLSSTGSNLNIVDLGSVRVNQTHLAVGNYTFYAQADASSENLVIYANGTDTYSIDNVSVKQVNGNPALMQNTPTIVTDAPLTKIRNYYRMGDGILDTHPLICDMVEPSLGSELVVNGNFATDSDWDKGSNWTIANNLATSDGSQTGNVSLFQLNSVNNFVTGKIYKVEFTISNYEAGVINPHIRGQASGNVSGNGLKTAYITAGSTSHGINLYAGSTFVGSISNVTAKQVNGVAGIMTNMSEADITNDVPS